MPRQAMGMRVSIEQLHRFQHGQLCQLPFRGFHRTPGPKQPAEGGFIWT